MSLKARFRALLLPALILGLAPFCPPDGAGAHDLAFPWTCREAGSSTPLVAPNHELQGEWISSFEPTRVLDIAQDRFSLQGTGNNLRGSVAESGPELVFTLEGNQSCRVLWQLLGDGRLGINSGQDLLHRRGEPAIPVTTVRQYGNSACRFTVAVPSVLPVEEIEDGVRVSTVERDGAMQILSGVTDKSCRQFAEAVASQLGSEDFRAMESLLQEQAGGNAQNRTGEDETYVFTATVRGIPIMQYIACQRNQYLHVSLMGQYNKLVSYLKQVKIVDPMQNAQ